MAEVKSDVRGCSTCKAGEERYEEFSASLCRGKRVQYDYRTPDGELFSCVAKTLQGARARRDLWLKEREAKR